MQHQVSGCYLFLKSISNSNFRTASPSVACTNSISTPWSILTGLPSLPFSPTSPLSPFCPASPCNSKYHPHVTKARRQRCCVKSLSRQIIHKSIKQHSKMNKITTSVTTDNYFQSLSSTNLFSCAARPTRMRPVVMPGGRASITYG